MFEHEIRFYYIIISLEQKFFALCLPLSFSSASTTPYVPLLSWKKAQDSVPWNIILLLGGGFAMAKACEVNTIVHAMHDDYYHTFKCSRAS